MSGATLSIRAHREFAGHVGFRTDDWSLELRVQSSESSESSDIRPGPARLLVRLRNFYDRPVFDVHDVSRVQFVPTAHDAHKFNLRLFRLLESEGEGAEDLVTGVRDSPIGELLLTFSRPRPNLLVFEEQDVLASRASWRTDVGWQLLRYATGSFFWQASADPSRHEQFLTPQPAEPPAEQDYAEQAYDISELLAAELLAAAQLTDTEVTDTEDDVKINEWRCAICHDGVAGGRQLASAHAPGLANGKLHVFHRQCLEEWRAFSSTCPTCKTKLSPKPLPAVWSAGSTRLSARMGVNTGVQNTLAQRVCDTRAAARTSNPYVLRIN